MSLALTFGFMNHGLYKLKEGDEVIRMLAGRIPMRMRITRVTEHTLECGDWTFDRFTGSEIDDDIPALVSWIRVPNEEDLDAEAV